MALFLRSLLAAALLFCLSASSAHAAGQDTVVMRGGTVRYGLVTDITRHRVLLREGDGGDTSHRRIDLRFVRSIACADGRRWPGDRETRRRQDSLYVVKRMARLAATSNYAYINPLSLQVLANGVGAGTGLGYGRKFSPHSHWAAEVSATGYFVRNGGFYKSWPASGLWSETALEGLYFAPGIHYNSAWRRGRLQTSLGVDLPTGWVNRTERFYEGGIELRSINRRDFLFGTELAASLRILSTRSAFILFRLAGGPVLVNNAEYGGMFRASSCVGFLH